MEHSFFEPNAVHSIPELKKRKRSSSSNASSSEDQEVEESKLLTEIQSKRQIHSKIEKRRRDKMNSYIAQLTNMIPMYNLTAQKLDKITVLRMTVQYLRSIQNSPMQLTSEENLRYSFINDEEMKRLILQQVSDGFLFVIACDSAKIMYISESVTKTLNCNRADLLDRSLYDVIHPLDVSKIKEQISGMETSPRSQLVGTSSSKDLDLKVPSEQLGLYPGNRRSFFFRIKSNLKNADKGSLDANEYSFSNYKGKNETAVPSNAPVDQNQYTIIQCVGYLKCWNSFNEKEKTVDNGEDISSLTRLIAVGRKLDNFSQLYQLENPCTFVSKHAVDGKFLFVDHWITIITGHLPQELLAMNIYDYIHPEDLNEFAAAHQSLLQFSNTSSVTQNFRFRTKFGNYINMQSEWKSLMNPWKREVEFFYSKNTVHWPKNMSSGEKEEKTPNSLEQNDLFAFTNFESRKPSDHNLILDFNFHNVISEKAGDEASMEAILKLLECDTNIAE